MSTNKMVAFAFAIVMALVMATTCRAQNTPQDYVNAHNKARAAVGVAGVSWDQTVQAYAQNYANQRKADCVFSHSMNRTYGENIAWGSSKDYSGIKAVNMWVAEKENYTYASNSCHAGPNQSCGHYTQVVWRTSTKIGCARVVCDKNAGVFITCNYSPPGNYPGQKPY